MLFRATDFEFQNRFWIFSLIFSAAFASYVFDPTNVAVALGGGDDFRVRALFLAGALLATLAALIRSWATAYLNSSVVHDRSLHTEHLLADGPYRYVRNPLYLGNNLLGCGIGLMASRLGYPVLVLGILLFNYRLILREESELLASQGESFRRYRDAVPRLLPALTPRVPAGGVHANWRDGISAECFVWGCAAGMAEFSVTLRLLDFWMIMGVGFGFYFLWAFLRSRSNKTAAVALNRSATKPADSVN
jgi:protein-S-isoprenylcysteine O-methyltransferase Ste14